jgi:hypothetical protein
MDQKFKNDDFSCDDDDDDSRPDRLLAIFGAILHKFLDKYPFSRARVISRHFRFSHQTMKEILIRELGLKQFSRRWVVHLLSDDLKKLHRNACNSATTRKGATLLSFHRQPRIWKTTIFLDESR